MSQDRTLSPWNTLLTSLWDTVLWLLSAHDCVPSSTDAPSPPAPTSAGALQGPTLSILSHFLYFQPGSRWWNSDPTSTLLSFKKKGPNANFLINFPFPKCDVYPALLVSVTSRQARNLPMSPDLLVGHHIRPMAPLVLLFGALSSLQCHGFSTCSHHSSWPPQKAPHWSSRV